MDDVGFESQDKDIKPTKQAYEVDFKVFDPIQIQAQQDNQISEVSKILSQPVEAAAILLRHSRWNRERLIDQYMEKMEEVLEDAGLGQDAATNPPQLQKIKGFVCDICCDDSPNLDTFAMKCEHRFCMDCYKQYLSNKIQDEGEAARIRCPGEGCTRIVDSKSLDLLVSHDLQARCVCLVIAREDCTDYSKIPSPPDTNIRRRPREPQVVSRSRLQIRRRVPYQEQRTHKSGADSTLRLRTRLLFRMCTEQPSTSSMFPGEEVAKEVRGRL